MRRLRLLLPAARRLRDAPGAVVHPTPVPSPPSRLLSHSSGRGRLARGAESLAPDHWPPTTPTLARYEIGASTRHRRPHLAARRRHCHGEGAAGGRGCPSTPHREPPVSERGGGGRRNGSGQSGGTHQNISHGRGGRQEAHVAKKGNNKPQKNSGQASGQRKPTVVMGGSTSRRVHAHACTPGACETGAAARGGTCRNNIGGGDRIRDRNSRIDAQRRLLQAAPPVTAARPGGADGGAIGRCDGWPRRRRPDGRQPTTAGGWRPRSPTQGEEG